MRTSLEVQQGAGNRGLTPLVVPAPPGTALTFETPACRTGNGIARIGNTAEAWLKDPDGNIPGLGQYR